MKVCKLVIYAVCFSFLICGTAFAGNPAAKAQKSIDKTVSSVGKKMSRLAASLDKKQENKLTKAKKKGVALCRYSRADYDWDGDVDDIDKGYFSFCFQTQGKGIACRGAANLDNDKAGKVDQSDLAIFAREYNRSQSGDIAALCVTPEPPTVNNGSGSKGKEPASQG